MTRQSAVRKKIQGLSGGWDGQVVMALSATHPR